MRTTAEVAGGLTSHETDEAIAVVGLGYVGLPLAIDLATAGYIVHGIDQSTHRVAELTAGRSYVDDVSDEGLKAALRTERLLLSDLTSGWDGEDVAFVCVPTPVTTSLEPDLEPILQAARYLRSGLRPGNLVVLQSTTYPGTTRGPFKAELEAGGLRAGDDFGLAYAPERVSPGDHIPGSQIPRVVGGIDATSTKRTSRILARISPSVYEMTQPDAAELAKLLENIFRNVNIALVNELALLCEKLSINVWEVIDGASTKPFGFMPFYPGAGVGGHCVPVDPYYLAARAREVGFHERFVETAGDINVRMPDHVVHLISMALSDRGKALKDARILLLGVAFKPNIGDHRNTPAAPIARALVDAGAAVSYHDPHVATFCPFERPDCDRCSRNEELEVALAGRPDCVVIVTPHQAIDWPLVFAEADLIVDTRNVNAVHAVRDHQVLLLGAGWVPSRTQRLGS